MAIENFTGFDVISDVGTDANSYVSVADTKVIWNLDPYKESTTLTDEEIGKAVITATRQLNMQYGSQYKGSIYDDTYALFFPRIDINDSRGIEIIDYTIFPPELAEATAIQSWYVGQSNRVIEVSPSNIKKNRMDGLGSQEFFSPSVQISAKNNMISDEVYLLIKAYITSGGSKYVDLLGRG